MCKNTLLVVIAQATISWVPLTQAACSAVVHDLHSVYRQEVNFNVNLL